MERFFGILHFPVYTFVIPGMVAVFLAAMTRNPRVSCRRLDSRVRENDVNRASEVPPKAGFMGKSVNYFLAFLKDADFLNKRRLLLKTRYFSARCSLGANFAAVGVLIAGEFFFLGLNLWHSHCSYHWHASGLFYELVACSYGTGVREKHPGTGESGEGPDRDLSETAAPSRTGEARQSRERSALLSRAKKNIALIPIHIQRRSPGRQRLNRSSQRRIRCRGSGRPSGRLNPNLRKGVCARAGIAFFVCRFSHWSAPTRRTRKTRARVPKVEKMA